MIRIALAAAMVALVSPAIAIDLTSPDVKDGAPFDTKFVCAKFGGQSISPALAWSNVPASAKSLAITMFDPDAGTAGFWHWLAVDIPATATGLAQNAGAANAAMPAGTKPLANGAGHANYDGPCPPPGKPHHYQITVWALPDATSAIPAGAKPADVGAWLTQHALEFGRITPVFGQ